MADKKVLTGADAFGALDEGNEETVSNEFTYLKSGNKFIVKVPGFNVIPEYVYGDFNKKIYSFIAENPSKKSAKGYPVENLTPFDLAWKHYKDQSEDWQDKMAQEANIYRAERKFTIGFYDLDTGEPIMVEFTRKQANAIKDTVFKYEKRLDQFAFELAKTGSGTNTVVTLSLIPVLDDLTDKQKENFEKLPNYFDASNFENLYYVMSDEEQIETLTRVGFDVKLIGLEPVASEQDGTETSAEADDVAKDGEDFGF